MCPKGIRSNTFSNSNSDILKMLDIFNIEIFVKEKLIQLQFDDLKKLIAVLDDLVAKGDTVM